MWKIISGGTINRISKIFINLHMKLAFGGKEKGLVNSEETVNWGRYIGNHLKNQRPQI